MSYEVDIKRMAMGCHSKLPLDAEILKGALLHKERYSSSHAKYFLRNYSTWFDEPVLESNLARLRTRMIPCWNEGLKFIFLETGLPSAVNCLLNEIYCEIPGFDIFKDPDTPVNWLCYKGMKASRKGVLVSTTPARALTAWKDELIEHGVYTDDPERFNEWAAEISNLWKIQYAAPEICIADGEDEIARVYRYGPRSCMSYRVADYASGISPVRVYDSPDVSLLYAQKEGRITARAILNNIDKGYVRIYGNDAALRGWLRKEGYNKSVGLNGCRLKYIRPPREVDGADFCKEQQILPYFDCESAAELVENPDGTKHWLMTPDGEYIGNSTSGFARYYEKIRCPHCDHTVDTVDDIAPVCVDGSFSDELYCYACVGEVIPDSARLTNVWVDESLERNRVAFVSASDLAKGIRYQFSYILENIVAIMDFVKAEDKAAIPRSKAHEYRPGAFISKRFLRQLRIDWGLSIPKACEYLTSVDGYGNVSYKSLRDFCDKLQAKAPEEEVES